MFVRNAFLAGLLASVTSALPSPRAAGGKLTIYWGAEDDNTSLESVCNDSTYDIVNLAFLNYFHSGGGFPSIEMAGLWDTTQAQKNAGATGLKDGSPIVDAIKTCQSNGKLVILSMGGANDYADVTLKSDQDGEDIADKVWNLFLGGTDHSELRPFGDVKLDGVDLDNESGNPTGYLAMVKRFKSNFANDSSKKYYLTAAPQCPFPDASQPLDVCQELDYVWVQFYNNGECNIAQSGFNEAVKNWSKGIGNAKLFIGGLASGSDGDQGYVDANTFNKAIQGVKSMNLPNYGGAMLWEAQLSNNNDHFSKKIRGNL